MAKRRRKSKELAIKKKEAEKSKKFVIMLAVIAGIFVLGFILLQFLGGSPSTP